MNKNQSTLRHEHFEQFKFHALKVQLNDGTRTIIHFKRMPQGEYGYEEKDDSFYSQIQKYLNFKQPTQDKASSAQLDAGEIPLNRSLILICFDHAIDEPQMMKVFSINGKVRRIFKGSFKVNAQQLNDLSFMKLEQKQKKVHVGLVVYKNEFDLIKCFDIDFFKARIQKKFLNIKGDDSGRNRYHENLFEKYETRDEQKDQWAQEAEEEGFEIVTNKNGDFAFDKPTDFKEHPARKRRTKKTDMKDSFYQYESELKNMQEALGDIPQAKSAKELMRLKKQELVKAFAQDKETLEKVKKIKQI